MKFTDISKLADWLHANAFATHRGIIHLASGQLLAFGNDGGLKVGEVEIFLEAVKNIGVQVRAEGSDDERYTWAIILEAKGANIDELNELLWVAWYQAKQCSPGPDEIEVIKREQNGKIPEIVSDIEWQ